MSKQARNQKKENKSLLGYSVAKGESLIRLPEETRELQIGHIGELGIGGAVKPDSYWDCWKGIKKHKKRDLQKCKELRLRGGSR